MIEPIKTYVTEVIHICEATENELKEYTGSGNLQFPALLAKIAIKFNWDEKQIRLADPIVRGYVRQHPEWHVTRGAKGGIMRADIFQKKAALQLEKNVLKQQMREEIEARVAAQMEAKHSNNAEEN